MPLVNCERILILTWSKNCILTDIITTAADATSDPHVVEIRTPKNAVFAITDCKLYVPGVTLLAENDNKLLEQLKKKKRKI